MSWRCVIDHEVGRIVAGYLARRAQEANLLDAALLFLGEELRGDWTTCAGAHLAQGAIECVRHAYELLGGRLPTSDVAAPSEGVASEVARACARADQLMRLAEELLGGGAAEGDDPPDDDQPEAPRPVEAAAAPAEKSTPCPDRVSVESAPSAPRCACPRPDWYVARGAPRLCMICGMEETSAPPLAWSTPCL